MNGYNTGVCSVSDATLKPSTVQCTSARYRPHIAMTPSDPDTMLTSLVEAQRITQMDG